MGMIIRALARLMALGSLLGAWVILLVCCLSVPTKSFTFSTTTFGNGDVLSLGMFGHCREHNGVQECSKTSVGYALNVTSFPQYSANPGALVNVTTKPLTSALIFFPLAVGATSLANLLALVPIRFVTILALAMNFLSIGATAIAFVLSLLVFTQANQALKLSFNPNSYVSPMLGNCVWFAAGALLATTGAFLFLLVALEPAKLRGSQPDNSLGETIYGASYDNALVVSDKYLREGERARSINGSSHGARAGRRDRSIDADRMSVGNRSNRSNHTARRSSISRNRDEEEFDDEEREERRSHRRQSSKASRRAAREAEEDDDETEEEEVRRPRKKSVRSRQSTRERRDADDSEDAAGGYVDFAGRRR